jgi:ABC-type amino acid transport substrate-binding protein
MKAKSVSVLFLLSALAVVATSCTPATPTAPPAEATGAAPTASLDPTWDRIQSAGTIVFGTSADYQPFEYYDPNYQITGFDAELARALGAKLGVNVDLVDIAFDGLASAIQVGQVDAAIAAISATPARQAAVDFTNVYYTGQDEILAREASGIGPITAPAQLAPYRVGVQRGSVYASWIRTALVDPGLMPAANLLEYEKATDAVRDLKENRNDLVVLDKLAADEYLPAGGVVPAGEGLNIQLYSIALPKGSPILQAKLNAALTELQVDGTIARLAMEFLGLDLSAGAALPTGTPVPGPTGTPVPGPTATPVGCLNAMAFIKDVTIPDGTEMKPGQDFDKTWRIKNTGTCDWNSNYKLVFVQGDRMGGEPTAVKGTVSSGANYDMTIDQKAPNNPGNYAGVWQMVDAQGTPFGERLWVKITVPGTSSPTARPSATSVPPVQPTAAPAPVIKSFKVEPSSVQTGQNVVVSWSYTGQDLASATLTRTNPDGSTTPLYGGADVPPKGEYDDLLTSPGTYSYKLNVASEFAGSAVQTVSVEVTSG